MQPPPPPLLLQLQLLPQCCLLIPIYDKRSFVVESLRIRGKNSALWYRKCTEIAVQREYRVSVLILCGLQGSVQNATENRCRTALSTESPGKLLTRNVLYFFCAFFLAVNVALVRWSCTPAPPFTPKEKTKQNVGQIRRKPRNQGELFFLFEILMSRSEKTFYSVVVRVGIDGQ